MFLFISTCSLSLVHFWSLPEEYLFLVQLNVKQNVQALTLVSIDSLITWGFRAESPTLQDGFNEKKSIEILIMVEYGDRSRSCVEDLIKTLLNYSFLCRSPWNQWNEYISLEDFLEVEENHKMSLKHVVLGNIMCRSSVQDIP